MSRHAAEDLTYRRPVSVWWWTRRRSYFVFVMRELSSLFIAWLVHYLLLFVRAVGRGETAYVGDRGFVMVRAEKTPASIRAAITAGDFYSSTGVLLDTVELTREAIAIDVRGGGEETAFEVIGRGGAVISRRWQRLRIVAGSRCGW